MSEPPLLADFTDTNPTKSWESFGSENRDTLSQIIAQLMQDQRGLCAYCEVDLQLSDGTGYDDFRIEHFHPKSDNHPHWTFRWDNLLAVCCGGNRSYLTEEAKDRFTSPDHSCDVPKGSKILDGLIFNPSKDEILLQPLFEFTNDGDMLVSEACPDEFKGLAERSINELNLSSRASQNAKNISTRLKKQRAAMIAGLGEQISIAMGSGMPVEEAMRFLARALYRDDNKAWPKFFSCARWYLGEIAEDRLVEIGYKT